MGFNVEMHCRKCYSDGVFSIQTQERKETNQQRKQIIILQDTGVQEHAHPDNSAKKRFTHRDDCWNVGDTPRTFETLHLPCSKGTGLQKDLGL